MELTSLLNVLELSAFLSAFEEEELSIGLLMSMSDPILSDCLRELGLSAEEGFRLTAVLSTLKGTELSSQSETGCAASVSPVEGPAPTGLQLDSSVATAGKGTTAGAVL
mmetsp:Transcript_9188/g.20665  ORF Transcript_9188/g.20665 Transcript_9188/m.20665 type:complete len:109 (-) Transcript_9188:1181-1507(-)